MKSIIRLIEGLLSGDSTTLYVLVFVIVGTLAIFVTTEIIQRRRRRQKQQGNQ